MDLFAIVGSIRRHWLMTSIVIALTVVACAWVLLVMPRDYEARASFVLVNPPPAPTEAQIALDPSLAQVNRDNPYLRFANEATVGQVLAARVGGGEVREALVAEGADGNYTIGASPGSAQIVDVIGTGTSAAAAEATLALVSQRTEEELRAMQTVNGADEVALIRMLPVAAPTGASVVLSGTVRSMVGVLGAGAIVLFTLISVAEGRAAGRRREEGRLAGGDGRTGSVRGRHEADPELQHSDEDWAGRDEPGSSDQAHPGRLAVPGEDEVPTPRTTRAAVGG